MGARFLLVAFLGIALCAQVQSGLVTERQAADSEAVKKWNVIGDWAAKTPDWKGKISIRPDGTFARGMGDGGKWRLTNKEGHAALVLDWEKWKENVLPMVSPDLFRAKVQRGTIELRRMQKDGSAENKPAEKPEWLDVYKDATLKERLDGSVWRLKDGKRFTLRADGTTTGSWHNRKGEWRIVGGNKIQLTINWRPNGPALATVESDGTVLRWTDTEWGQMARRVEKKTGD